LAELSDLLAPAAEARLVTVVGPGGMGKTRLALEAASGQPDCYPDGVWFISLASVQSAEVIASTMAQVLGVSFFGTDPPRQQLLRYLREKRMLLVLDNLEHLLEGVDLLVELLRTAPGVRLLVTSRVRLNVMGELVFVLAGMDYPESSAEGSVPGNLRRHSSVVLFLRSARRVRSKFELAEEDLPHVARICRLAQGMPLAILLAAAWVPALTPAEIAAEMERSLDFLAADWRDEPERHHSMRAVFDATWRMLPEEEREASARLSVFRGGFTREAAQAVAGADLRTLISLVIKSLLQRDQGGRYEIHELLRQYVAGKLEEAPEEREETLDLHSAYYAELLRRREVDLQKGHLEETLVEMDNIRFAWQRIVAKHKIADLHKCVLGLSILYGRPGLLQEGQALFAEATDALRPGQAGDLDAKDGAAVGLALVMHGFYSAYLGQAEEAQALMEESLSLLRRLGAQRELAFAYGIAVAAGVLEEKDLSDAKQLLEERAAISSEMSDDLAGAWTLWLLGRIALRLGATEDAERYCRKALSIARRIDDDYDAAYALVFLGHTLYKRGEYAEARQCYEESLVLFVEMGQQLPLGRLHSHLGDATWALRQYESARRHHQHALSVYQDIGVYWKEEPVNLGVSWGVPVSLQTLGDVALAQGDLAEARHYYGLALDAASGRPEEGLKPHVLLGPATLLARTGEVELAVELVALARHHPASVEETRGKAGELLDGLQAELPAEAYAAAETRGRARDLEVTIGELLAELGNT
jgi:predicted ATPase/Tfp pilus assembly protein PilF